MSDEPAQRFPVPHAVRVEELIEIYDGIIPEVEEELQKAAVSTVLPVPSCPDGLENMLEFEENGDPRMPDDLTVLTDEDTGKLFSLFTNWANYLQAEATRAKCIKLVLERDSKVIESALNVYYKEELEIPANAVPDKVNTDKRYVDVDASLLRASVYYIQTNSRYEQFKRTLNNISREQTRRAEEMQRERHSPEGRTKAGPWTRGTRFSRRRGKSDE